MSVIKPAIRHPSLIAYLSGANNYTWLHFRNGEKKMLAKPISFLETQLTDFVRVHKTALVNPACVEKIQHPPRQRMAGSVQLEGGVELPVSRRRWREVVEALNPYLQPGNVPSDGVPVRLVPATTSTTTGTVRSLILVTEDTGLPTIKEAMEAKWPQYVLHGQAKSSLLPSVLSLLSADELPTLIMLDARTATLERLNTLEQLKNHPTFGQIPVILLLLPADDTITGGYQRRANSVIVLPDSQTPLTPTLERICEFWLHIAALPTPRSLLA